MSRLRLVASSFGFHSLCLHSVAYIYHKTRNTMMDMMSKYDNKMLNELYSDLDELYQEASDIRRFHKTEDGRDKDTALQEIEEEIIYIKMRIEEIAIIQSDYTDEL